jgi:hypothetical protein
MTTMHSFAGMGIVESAECVRRVPIFPDKPSTKRRKRRTLGKFGRLDRPEYFSFMLNARTIVIHPLQAKMLRRETEKG